MTMRNDMFPSGFVAVTPGTAALNLCGLLAGGAGTATVTDEHGISTTITLAAGIPVYGRIVQVTAATATSLVGLVP